jgi:ADP-heptose:LPS heptosyltransferase
LKNDGTHSRADWGDIRDYLRQHNIAVIINLQNEGPRYDLNYYAYKEAHPGEYWELDFNAIYSAREHVHILESTRTMLAAHHVAWWYPSGEPAAGRNDVVFYVGASETNKRWDADRWVDVIRRLAVVYPSLCFSVLTGHSEAERDEATDIQQGLLDQRNVEVVVATSLEDNLVRLCAALLVVSHDTYPVHLASLLAIPAFGVYFSTDPIIWGSYENEFRTVWSALDCGGRKQGTGNCAHFHTRCPNLDALRNAVTVEQVVHEASSFIEKLTNLHRSNR